MNELISNDSIGGGSLIGGKAAEKVMDKKVGKDTCCPSLTFYFPLEILWFPILLYPW